MAGPPHRQGLGACYVAVLGHGIGENNTVTPKILIFNFPEGLIMKMIGYVTNYATKLFLVNEVPLRVCTITLRSSFLEAGRDP